MSFVNRYTRAGQQGKEIQCPVCNENHVVYHFAWSALTCHVCESDVEKLNWKLT